MRRWIAWLVAGGAAAASLAVEPPQVRETIEVRERLVLIDAAAAGRELEPADLVVLEDGAVRKPTSVARSDGEGDWKILIWFEPGTMAPRDRAGAALALARESRDLVDLGEVEVVVSDRQVESRLAPSRDPLALEAALAKIAGEAQREGERSLASSLPAFSTQRFAEALDELVLHALTRSTTGPATVLFVGRGPTLEPDDLADLAGAEASAGAVRRLSVSTFEASRVLSAYGWSLLALPVRDAIDQPRRSGQDVSPVLGPDGKERFFFGLIWPPSKWRRRIASEARFAAQIEPSSAPLSLMVRTTAGHFVSIVELLRPALESLRSRHRLAYLSVANAPGRPSPLEVRLAKGGRALRAPQWVRTSTPPELAAIRLRRLGAGASDSSPGCTLTAAWTANGSLEVQGEFHGGEGPVASSGSEGGRDSALTATAWGRASLLCLDPQAAWAVHAPAQRGSMAEGSVRFAIAISPPAGCRRAALAVDDLGAESWCGALCELGVSPHCALPAH